MDVDLDRDFLLQLRELKVLMDKEYLDEHKRYHALLSGIKNNLCGSSGISFMHTLLLDQIVLKRYIIITYVEAVKYLSCTHIIVKDQIVLKRCIRITHVDSLLPIGKSSPCSGGSRFPLLSFTICMMPYKP